MKTIATKHFNRSTIKALKLKGLSIMGMTAIPAFPGDSYFSGTAYTMSDGRIKTFLEILSIAEGR